MKTIIPVMVLSIGATALSACTTYKAADGRTCPYKPTSTITADDGELTVKDKKIHVCSGDSVRLTFKNPMPGMGMARTLPKDATNPDHRWLNATYDGQAITVTPLSTTTSGEYGYIIEVDGIGRLDPRFVVQ